MSFDGDAGAWAEMLRRQVDKPAVDMSSEAQLRRHQDRAAETQAGIDAASRRYCAAHTDELEWRHYYR